MLFWVLAFGVLSPGTSYKSFIPPHGSEVQTPFVLALGRTKRSPGGARTPRTPMLSQNIPTPVPFIPHLGLFT